MKNFNILGIHWKIWLSEGGVHKKQIKRRDCPKRGAWTAWKFKGRTCQERGDSVFWRGRGGLIPRYTLCFLAKLKGKGRPFLEGPKKFSHIARLPARALGCHKRRKNLSFCETWNNPTPPLFFITPSYKYALQDMEFYDKFVDRFQDISKV